MRYTNILLVCSAAAGLVFHFTGNYLLRIYGFDPPYGYHFAGLIFALASYLCFVVCCLTLLFILWRKFRKRND